MKLCWNDLNCLNYVSLKNFRMRRLAIILLLGTRLDLPTWIFPAPVILRKQYTYSSNKSEPDGFWRAIFSHLHKKQYDLYVDFSLMARKIDKWDKWIYSSY